MQSRLMRFVPDWDDVWLVANSHHCGAHLTEKGALIVKAPKYRRHDDLEKKNRVLFIGILDDMGVVPDEELAPLRLYQAKWQRHAGMPVVFCNIREARLLNTQPIIRALPLLTRSAFVNSQMNPSPLLRQWLAEWVGISPGALDLMLEEWSGLKDIARLWRAWATVDAHVGTAMRNWARIVKTIDEAQVVDGRRIDFDALFETMDKAFSMLGLWNHHATQAETDAMDHFRHEMLAPPYPRQPHEVVPLDAEDFRERVEQHISIPLRENRYMLFNKTRDRVLKVQGLNLVTGENARSTFESGVKAAMKSILMLSAPTARQRADEPFHGVRLAWPLLGLHGRFVQLALSLRQRPYGHWSWAGAKHDMPREKLRQAMADMRQRLWSKDAQLPAAVPARFTPRQKTQAKNLRLMTITAHQFYGSDWKAGFERVIRSWQW